MKNLMRFNATVQNAFDNDQANFEDFHKLLLDCSRNTVEEYSNKEANAKIVSKFKEALGISEDDRPQQVKRIIRQNRELVYTLIEETVEDMLITGWMNNPFFQAYMESKNLALGDENDFYVEDDSILSVSKISGNHHNMIRQRLGAGRHFSVAGEWYGIKIYSDFERVMTNAEDWATFVNKVTDAINRYLLDAVYAAFKDAKTKLGTNWVGTGSLKSNKDKFIKLCQDVEMATGKAVTIFGSKSALSKLFALTAPEMYSNEMKNAAYANGGILASWEGFNVAEIGQGLKRGANINSATVEYMLDTNVLYIMPGADEKFIKVVNYGETQVSQVTDKDTNRDMSQEYEVQYKMGINILLNTVFGVWSDVTA